MENLRKCAASVTALDDQIPLLQRKLISKGVWENTIVIFSGDNGFLLGRHGLWSKGHASNPINMYDEVMAVPMLWQWPGRIPGGLGAAGVDQLLRLPADSLRSGRGEAAGGAEPVRAQLSDA